MTKPLGPLPFVALACVTWLGGVLGGAMLVGAEPVLVPTPTPTVAIVPIQPEPTPSPSIVSPNPGPTPTTVVPAPTAPPSSPASTQPPATKPPPATPSPSPKPPRRTPPPSPTPSPLPTPDPSPTPAATTSPPLIALTCANGVDNGGGTGTICEITINPDSATVRECHGAAGDPTALCVTTTYLGRVTSVDQCNGSANGGGATLRCSVLVIGGSGSGSVNQCVGSGQGGTLVEMTCTDAGSGGVTVNQCNGSGNGGGALVVCTVRVG